MNFSKYPYLYLHIFLYVKNISVNTILLVFPFLSFAQVKTIGTPNIQNYPKSVYKAGTQNWGIAEDNNGFMYFANNDGVLQFEGFHWQLIDVPLS